MLNEIEAQFLVHTTVVKTTMESLILLILISSVLQTEVQSAALKQLLLPLDSQQEECIKELHLDREMTAYLSTQEFPPEENPSFNDFFSCTWKKQGYQHQDGRLNYEALEEMIFEFLREQAGTSRYALSLAKEMSVMAVDDCTNVRGSSHGQTAVMMQNCMYRKLMALARESRHISEKHKAGQS